MKSMYHIDKGRVLTTAQDYELLRAEGQKHIEALSHKLWTDFNAHDPGITILEVLCYAITELGYRANFNIEDLLANKDGTIQNNTFFPAKEILTNAPLTTLDYRKLLIDIKGVNNAWVIHGENIEDTLGYQMPLASEIPVYINEKEDKLSVSSIDRFGNPLNKLLVRGLNKVIVELSEDTDLGPLNDVSLENSWLESGRFVEVLITTEFDSWNDQKSEWLQVMSDPLKIKIGNVIKLKDAVRITVHKIVDTTASIELTITPFDISELQLTLDHFIKLQFISDVINRLSQKREKIIRIYDEIRKVLNKNRNLTEDWKCIETINTVEIGICADIELIAEADAEEVLAKVQQTIDLILNPPIRFYTLNQMLDKKFNSEDIFNGPSLKYGFLMDDEVINSQLPDCIHASDIIASLMELEGVKAVNNMLLTAYDSKGNIIESAKNKSWCLHLNGQQKPVFNFKKSKLLLFRDGIPFLIPENGTYEFSQGVYYLKTENNTYKLQDPNLDFAFPSGTHFQLDDYYSIQNDFPATYGIGEGQLLTTATPLRKAQAKQLKAYLQHFDQLLADFFKQLYQSKELLDSAAIENTYFTQYIEDVSGIDEDLFWKEAYAASFKTTVLNGEGIEGRSLYEDDKLFYNRRNRFLDHLLARFGESFNDYVFMMYSMQENANGTAEMTLQKDELIKDKQRFLNNYPELSYHRGVGINYCQENSGVASLLWNSSERGGYEKRVAALLGINNIKLTNIVDAQPKQTWQYTTELGVLEFQLQNTVSLALKEKWELAQMLINNVSAYKVFTFTKSYIYFVNKEHKKIAKLTKEFNSPLDAEEFIPKLYQAINSQLENFYCLEHILLRPLVHENLLDKDLLTVCLDDDCFSEANNDPYSFKATLVLPGWLARFRNRYFRRYAENILRKEAPAHTLIKVCWIGRDDMITFQKVYRSWIIAYKKIKTEYCDNTLSQSAKKTYAKKLSDLITQLKELNTIYDEGTLYDCHESELNNPILLNNSSLGTLQNIQL